MRPAARHLDLTKSTLSRRLGNLEERLGVPLFHRGPKALVLTGFGRECYAQCVRVILEADKVSEMADRAGATPTGPLHVICPPLLGTLVIERLAAEFAIEAPRVRLHLEETASIIDPRMVSADLVIYGTFDPPPDLDLVARRIFMSPYALVANPDVFVGGNLPTEPKDLQNFDAIAFGSKSTRWTWRLKRGRETFLRSFEPRFSTTQLSALVAAARQGLGIASLPQPICQQEFARGRLVHVLPDWEPSGATIYAIYPSRRSLTAAAERFLDLMVMRLPDLLAGYTRDP